MWPLIYNGVMLPVARILVWVVSRGHRKTRESLQQKKGIWGRLRSRLAERDKSRPLVWFHAPSVGEYLLAQPVLEKLIEMKVDCIVTYNSVSTARWLERTSGDFENQLVSIDSMPIDSLSNMKRWYQLVKPSAVVFVIYDLWPNAIWQAFKRQIPLYLLSASIRPASLRETSIIGRSLYRNLYEKFAGIFAITEAEKEKFIQTAPGLQTVEVFGNTKFESALDRRDRLTPPTLPESIVNNRIFIAGSTWPPDENCIFPAIDKALGLYDDLMVIIAPHEPTEDHLAHAEHYFASRHIERLSRLTPTTSNAVDIILVDSIGILSTLYKIGDIAFVGGGFTTGVHNVLEPAVNGLPVLFGPRYANAPEATGLVSEGLAYSISTPEAFDTILGELLASPDEIERKKEDIRGFIECQRGAADKSFQKIAGGLRRPGRF